MRAFREQLNVGLLSLVSALLVVGVLNFAVEFYFRRNPAALMDAAARNDPTDRFFRENLVPADIASEFYDLRSADEVREMFAERFAHSERYEPYTQWRLSPFIGKYHGVSEHGYRLARDPGPWPPDVANYNIFFFGNSTGFGVAPYWATVASYLQDAMNTSARLDRKVYVYNFSRPGYITRQEQILFFRLLEEYPAPNMAVFLDGVADFCFVDGNPSNWRGIAAYYDANAGDREAAAASYSVMTHWEKLRDFVMSLPLTRALDALRHRMATSDDALPAPAETPAGETVLRQVIDRYYGFVRQVRAVANAYKVQPIFVWQPTPLYKYDRKYHLFNPTRLGCQINNVVGYPLTKAALQKQPLGSDFIWAADIQQDLHEPLYVDWFHYNAPMSRRIADYILDTVRERQLLGGAAGSSEARPEGTQTIAR